MSQLQNTVLRETIFENYEMGFTTKEQAVEQANRCGFGDLVELLEVCPECNGTGVVKEGRFDDVREVKCLCQLNKDCAYDEVSQDE